MRHLNRVEENGILELTGISHHTALAHQHSAANEGSRPNLGVLSDDGRAANRGRGGNDGTFGDPYVLSRVIVFLRGKGLSQRADKLLDAGKRFPRILTIVQQRGGKRMGQIVQLLCFQTF